MSSRAAVRHTGCCTGVALGETSERGRPKLGLPVLGAILLGLPSEEAVVDGVLYVGTLMSAISGVISRAPSRWTCSSCVIVGCITAMAGGSDVVLNRPPFWITYPSHLHAAVWGSLDTFVLWPLIINHSAFKDTHLAFLWSDAIGMASSTVVGTEIGFAETGQWQAAVTTAFATATFGGIMRDVLCLDRARSTPSDRCAPRRANSARLPGAAQRAILRVQFELDAILRRRTRAPPVRDAALLGAATYAFLRQLNEDTILSQPADPRLGGGVRAVHPRAALRALAWTYRLALPHWARKTEYFFFQKSERIEVKMESAKKLEDQDVG